MGNTKAIVFWLSGAKLADLASLPEVEALRERGAMVELESQPITGPLLQQYQAISGQTTASFGLFDTLVPRNYAAVEETAGRGTPPKSLADRLRTVGWTVEYREIPAQELPSAVQQWAQDAPTAQACLVVKAAVTQGMKEAEIKAVGEALQLAQAWVGEDGLLAVFSDTQPAEVKRFVNVNDFLAEMGIIERNEQSGQVNWKDSLAYHIGHGQLWVNLLGRDTQGVVHPQDEFEEVLDTLVKALPNKLRDPESGEPVIERVYRKEELYSGDYLFCAPDLVIVFKPGYAPSAQSSRVGFDGTTFTPGSGKTALAGVHPAAVRGFLLAASSALAAGTTVDEIAPLTAVTATILHALGVEYVDVDSPAVSALFSSGYLETHSIRSGSQSQELSDEDEELIISHLRDLGYV